MMRSKRGCSEDQYMRHTYVPSGRRDSGMTRSRVCGSTAMPAVVFSGLRGGRDILVEESSLIRTKAVSNLHSNSISRPRAESKLLSHINLFLDFETFIIFRINYHHHHALCCSCHRSRRRRKVDVHELVSQPSPGLQTHSPPCESRPRCLVDQLRSGTSYRHQESY